MPTVDHRPWQTCRNPYRGQADVIFLGLIINGPVDTLLSRTLDVGRKL